ncbi:hypothetical protein PLESTF_001939000 [Pleodorina starrii]|nr:hypothetical protein PLESTF_001939000 [Pleodorina starrii]
MVVFNATNFYRARHQAPPLAWSEALARDATAYAQVLAAKSCLLKHASYGENLMQVIGYPKPTVSCLGAIHGWYSQALLYNFAAKYPYTANWPKKIGHFSQLVWSDSSLFGCGVAVADVAIAGQGRTYPGGCRMVVCRYLSFGNVALDYMFLKNGERRAEVPPRRRAASCFKIRALAPRLLRPAVAC